MIWRFFDAKIVGPSGTGDKAFLETVAWTIFDWSRTISYGLFLVPFNVTAGIVSGFLAALEDVRGGDY